MELTVTQPIFLWLLGIIFVLGVFALIALVTILFQVVRLLKLASEKAVDVAAMVDEVRTTVHHATETVNETKDRIASLVTVMTSAAGIGKVVASVRDAWKRRPESDED